MRHEAAVEVEAVVPEIRLLVETGFASEGHALLARLRAAKPGDPELLGMQIWIDQRRGAISEALDGWRRLHEARPNGGMAMARLAQLRAEESLQPVRADLPVVRRALRAVAAGQHDRALAICRQGMAPLIAAGDKEQRKLLALIEALLHELAGRPAAAAAVLTDLGRDPAFAHDIDRLAILARVCEQAGDRAGLAAAERVLAFLASSGILSAWPRLRQIRRLLGDEQGAAELERRWEEAFRRRIHRSTPEERLLAAVRRYVPVERLRPLSLPDAARIEDPVMRAVRQLVDGDAQAALPHLGGLPAWRAEALQLIGDRHAAREAAAEAVRAEANLPHALLFAGLLDDDSVVDGDLLLRVRAVLREATAHGPASPELLRAHARCARLTGDRAGADALEARAAAAARRRTPAPGVVQAAAIYTLPGRAIGLVHQLVVRPIAAGRRARGTLIDEEIHGELAPGVRRQIRRTFAAVRETLEALRPERASSFDRCAWSIHLTKEDEPSGGPSLGLPTAMAFASALLDEPIRPSLVFTGALSYDATSVLAVRPVGELGRKLEAALHLGAEALVLPAAQHEEALSGQVVPPSFAREIARPVATFDEALEIAFG